MKNGLYSSAKFEIDIYERLGSNDVMVKITHDSFPGEAYILTGERALKAVDFLKDAIGSEDKGEA